ncbi:O-antigen ligase family protein [Filobacillus milosensis]|uniref:O-antigen ligase family protein n=1 Tax=Filobacillus milosensis TaxID=94137 RepID=A0A4Y8II58_9BACI|nr:O-antigen ligase family protein [Filobacillus milosensis]TFB18908.1 O-antigen ligase family protein [Filobacillus milosensis]
MMLTRKAIDFGVIRLLVFFIPFMFYINLIVQLNVSLADLFMMIVLLWFLIDHDNRKILAVVINKYHLILVYMLLLIYFCILSMLNYITNTTIDFPYGVSAILKLSVNFVYITIFLVYLEKYKGEILNTILKWWKYVAVIISLICIGSVFLYSNGNDYGLTLDGRAQGTFKDPNLAALYLIVSFTIIALLNLFSNKKTSISLSMVIVLIAILVTASRGGILGISLGLMLVIFLSFIAGRVKELFLFLIMTVLCSTIILWIDSSSDVLSFAFERVSGISVQEEGTSYRLFLWQSAIKVWEANPIIGAGIGQFSTYSHEMFGYTISHIPHNTYLSFLSETGLLGFIAFMWFPLFLISVLAIGLVSTGEKLYFYALLGFVAIAIQALTINIENLRFIWIFITIIFFIIKNDQKPLVAKGP